MQKDKYFTLSSYQYFVSIHNGVQSVGHCHYSAVFESRSDRLLNEFISAEQCQANGLTVQCHRVCMSGVDYQVISKHTGVVFTWYQH